MAAATPPAEAVSPPVKAPSTPFSATASRTPVASRLPKPVSGTVAPACAHRAEHHARDDVGGEYPRRGEAGPVYEHLADRAERSADGKGL